MPVNDIWVGTTSNTWTTTTNWSAGSVPVAGDTVFFGTTSGTFPDVDASDQSTVTLAALNVDSNYTGAWGNSTTYMQIAATIANLFRLPTSGTNGNSSRRFNWDAGSVTSTTNIYASASVSLDSGFAPIRLKGTALTINLFGGTVSVASLPTETSTLPNLTVAGGTIILGAGVTIGTAIYQSGGTINSSSGIAIPLARVAKSGAIFNHTGTGGFTTLNVDAGKMLYKGTGTVTTLNLTGTIDLSGGGSAVTFTNTNVYAGAKFIDPNKRAVFTNPIQLVNCALSDVSFDVGQNRTVQFA